MLEDPLAIRLPPLCTEGGVYAFLLGLAHRHGRGVMTHPVPDDVSCGFVGLVSGA